jgi:hypothetical protein
VNSLNGIFLTKGEEMRIDRRSDHSAIGIVVASR